MKKTAILLKSVSQINLIIFLFGILSNIRNMKYFQEIVVHNVDVYMKSLNSKTNKRQFQRF